MCHQLFVNLTSSYKRLETKRPSEKIQLSIISEGLSLVGMTGFEPAAYYPRSNRATKLRHIPMNY